MYKDGGCYHWISFLLSEKKMQEDLLIYICIVWTRKYLWTMEEFLRRIYARRETLVTGNVLSDSLCSSACPAVKAVALFTYVHSFTADWLQGSLDHAVRLEHLK